MQRITPQPIKEIKMKHHNKISGIESPLPNAEGANDAELQQEKIKQ